MSATPQTLPTAPLEHLAMDYARLRAEGVRLLGALAGDQWTDFNSHDPGITILEQLCYAITDLAYRVDFPIPDLLAGPGFDASASMPSAATILGCDPVTSEDLRKLALDASGAANAWVEAQTELPCPVYHHAASRALHLDPDPGAVEAGAVVPRGLHQVWLPTGASNGAAGREASFARLHARRPLGEDIEISLLSTQAIDLDAAIEVEASDQPDRVLAAVVAAIDRYLSPTVGFEDLAAAQAHAATSEELFCGPQLQRGFVQAHALAASPRRRVVYGSDLLHAITDVPGVRAVRSLTMATSRGGAREQWALEIDEGRIPSLDPNSRIRLLRNGRPLQRSGYSVADALAEHQVRDVPPILGLRRRDLPVPRGRDRNVARYHSILDQLPQVYGVGRFGLPRSASAQRQAQARQLRAYLLIFDQLLANMFAQLAHARELFSAFGEAPQTYWSQVVGDPVIDLDELRAGTPERHAAWLEAATLSTATDELGSLDRRSRFLSHLLARYAEQLDAEGSGSSSGSATEQTLDFIRRKLAFLRAYPELGAARGRGIDLTQTSGRSGLAERVRLELGIADEVRDVFVIEHVLLRPIAEDRNQRGEEGEDAVPLLVGVEQADPWSGQISVVCRDRSAELSADDLEAYEQLVEHLVGEHCPAHLSVNLLWLGDAAERADWTNFLAAHDDLRASLAAYRIRLANLGSVETLDQLRLRDARDRMLEVLGIGETFPLRDIPLPSSLVVPANTAATIELGYTQPGVVYQLADPRSGQVIEQGGEAVAIVGTGAAMQLLTPLILEDVDYKIRALRTDPARPQSQREAWLHTAITIREGVDPKLDARIVAPLLDRSIDNPKSTDARLIGYGDSVAVEVLLSQEGVHYELVDHADPDVILSTATALGTGATITLQSVAFHEDTDLRIRGRKNLEDGDAQTREALLDIVLPLRVLANTNVEVAAAAEVIDWASAARIRVRGSQPGVRYSVHTRAILDAEFLFEDPPLTPSVDVSVAEGHVVRVARPPWSERWSRGDAWPRQDSLRNGNGTTLSFAIGELQADVLALARATKTHELGPLDAATSAGTLDSAVELEQAAVVLVRPDPAPALQVALAASGDAIVLRGGQPGVYYTLTGVGESPSPARPAYFHQRDANDARLNKGVEQLRVEGDLAVAGDPEVAGDPLVDAPPDPSLELAGVAVGDRWTVQARKATTDLEAPLTAELVLE